MNDAGNTYSQHVAECNAFMVAQGVKMWITRRQSHLWRKEEMCYTQESVKERREMGDVVVEHTPTGEMIADTLSMITCLYQRVRCNIVSWSGTWLAITHIHSMHTAERRHICYTRARVHVQSMAAAYLCNVTYPVCGDVRMQNSVCIWPSADTIPTPKTLAMFSPRTSFTTPVDLAMTSVDMLFVVYTCVCLIIHICPTKPLY